jgi:hypothetical protein
VLISCGLSKDTTRGQPTLAYKYSSSINFGRNVGTVVLSMKGSSLYLL